MSPGDIPMELADVGGKFKTVILNGTATSGVFLTDGTSLSLLNTDSVDFANRELLDGSGNVSLGWDTRFLLDSAGATSLDWQNRTLNDNSGTTFLDYQTGIFNGQITGPFQTAATADSFMTRALMDARGGHTIIGMSIADETVTNSATLVSSASVRATLPPGSWYFETLIDLTATATTGVGSKFNFRFTGTSSSARISPFVASSTQTSNVNQNGIYQTGQNLPYAVIGANGSLLVRATGFVVVTAQGILEVQFAQNTATPAQSAILRNGSYLLATQIS